MANTKISALPAASTPLAGTEVLPVVQGGITEQVSVDNLTAGRAVSAASLNLTGNAVLGDAATDTVRVNGYMGVGGAANAAYGILSTGAATSGANQYSVGVTATLGGTTWSSAYLAGMTIAASTTAASGAGLRVINPTLASGAAITTNYGVRVDDLTVGTTNYGIGLAVSSGTGKYNVYANGTADSYFAGNLLVAQTSQTGTAATFAVSNSNNNGNAARIGLTSIGGTTGGAGYPQIGYNTTFTSTSTINYLGSDFAAWIRFGSSGRVETFTAASGTGGNAISATTGPYVAQGGTSWTNSSDERLKDIIEPITDATNKVGQLRAVIGKFKTDTENKRRSFLLAQDVQSVLPEAVDASDPESLGVQYTDVIPLLVAAIKEQSQLITTLTDRITALEGAK
jgi:hypothetical protein